MRLISVATSLLASALATTSAAAIELTLWEHEYEDVQKGLDLVIAGFQKDQPGIKIRRSHYKTEDLRTQFQTAAMGGGGSDLVFAPNDFGGPFAIMNVIQPLTDWVKPERFGALVVQAVTDSKGVIWGLPVSRGNHLMLFANKKLVPQAPQTIEELITLAKAKSNPSKREFGFAYNLTEPFFFVPFMAAWGESPLVKAEPKLAGEGMVGSLSLVRDLKFKDQVVPPDCDYACAETLFVDGKVGMIVNGDWAVSKYRQELKDNLIIAPLPRLAATGKHMAPMISGKYLFLNAKLKGDRLEAAKKFGEYLVSKPVQEQLVRETGRLPSLKALDGSPVITADPTLLATDAAMAHGQPMPMDVELRVVWDAIRPQLQAVMAGRADPKAAAAKMQKDAETKIKEMKQ